MEEQLQHHQVKKNALISTASLFFQSGYSSLLGLAANLVLTILLSPKIFGIYITVLSLITFLNYFSDIGLAASLIQKKELKDDDIKTTFTIQQILIITLIGIGFLVSPFIQRFYNLPPDGVYLFQALLISFFISSLKTIPSVLLERKIQYQKIVLVQIIENTVFYGSVIILALMNFGLMSFTYSVLLRAVVGLIAIYSLSFWLPQFGISVKSFKELIKFGLPFQASSFLALFKDDLIILYLGKALGFEAVGYIGWAKKWAEAPLRIIMDNITKVIFPVIARFQDDKPKITNLIEKLFYYMSAILAPTLLIALFIMPLLVSFIPNYAKWTPALPLFYIFVVSSFIVSFTAPFVNIFNALGKVKITFGFMLLWTIIMWTLTPLFVSLFGMYGFPLAHLAVSMSGLLIIGTAHKYISFQMLKIIYPSLLSLIPVFVLLYGIISFVPFSSLIGVGLIIVMGYSIFLLSLLILFKKNIIKDARYFFIS